VVIASTVHPFFFPGWQPWLREGAEAKDLVLWLPLSSCCSCHCNSLWPLPLPALIPDLQSLGSSSEARSQHHGNPTSLSIAGWLDSSNTGGRSGLGRRAEWPLRSGAWSASGQQLPASTSGYTYVHHSVHIPTLCALDFGGGRGKGGREMHIGLKEL
jgi:hypothetical protein